MTHDDFEVAKTGTHRLLMLHAMALRSALEVIDLLQTTTDDQDKAAEIQKDGQRALETLDLLRLELGPEYQRHE